MRLRHIFQKARALAWHLYHMDYDVGMVVLLVCMVGILVIICIALYHLWEAIRVFQSSHYLCHYNVHYLFH